MARIMITWGIISTCIIFARDDTTPQGPTRTVEIFDVSSIKANIDPSPFNLGGIRLKVETSGRTFGGARLVTKSPVVLRTFNNVFHDKTVR